MNKFTLKFLTILLFGYSTLVFGSGVTIQNFSGKTIWATSTYHLPLKDQKLSKDPKTNKDVRTTEVEIDGKKLLFIEIPNNRQEYIKTQGGKRTLYWFEDAKNQIIYRTAEESFQNPDLLFIGFKDPNSIVKQNNIYVPKNNAIPNIKHYYLKEAILGIAKSEKSGEALTIGTAIPPQKPSEKKPEPSAKPTIRLKTIKYYKPGEKFEIKFNQDSCIICFSSIADLLKDNKGLVELPCKHIYCLDCITEHFFTKDNIKHSYNQFCPTCKHKMSDEEIESFFLDLLNNNLLNDEQKQKLLFLAATKGYIEVLEKLFVKGNKLKINNCMQGENYQGKEDNKWTPLHFAADQNKFEEYRNEKRAKTIEILINNGANVKAKNFAGRKPIDLIIETHKNSPAYKYLSSKMSK